MVGEWLDRLREKKKWIIGIGLILLAGAGFFFYPVGEKDNLFQPVSNNTSTQPKEEKVGGDAKQKVEIVVDLKGAIKHPGIYHLATGARLYQAIEMAGGTLEKADIRQINGAQILQDGEAVYIPSIGENNENPDNGVGSLNPNSSGTNKKININKASEEELQNLTGIGPSKAKAIVQYREEHGAFKSVDDLKNVTGIGDKTLEKIKPELTTS